METPIGERLQRRHQASPWRAGDRGYTLVELMIGLAVVAILLTVGVPSFETTINSNRLATASNEMLVSLQTARIEAIRFNNRTSVCLSRDADTAAPHCVAANATNATGWITFVDDNRNGTYEAASDRLLRASTLPARVVVLASPSVPSKVRVTFRADGFARDASNSTMLTAAIDFCVPTRRPAENVRRLVIGTGSRIAVQRENTNGLCSAPADPT